MFEMKGIVSNSVMPGVITTNLSRHMPEAQREELKKRFKNRKSVEAGASTTVWAGLKLIPNEIFC